MRIRPFHDGDAYATFRNILDKTRGEIESLENDYVLKASPTELERYFLDKAVVSPLILDAKGHYIDAQRGVQIDVTGDFRRGAFGRERVTVKGTELDIAIPFTGDPVLWRLRPSSYSWSGYPELDIRDDVVVFRCRFADDAPEPEQLKSEIERNIESLSRAVQSLASNVEAHNREAAQVVATALERKVAKTKVAVSAVAGLGIPVKQRATPETFIAPAKRRQIPVSKPSVPKDAFTPEPVLAQQEYEHILKVLRSMALVIERSPASFASLDEEAIRTHFLLQLNGHYEGSATGETFNSSGKTDILIRAGDRNAFIAECKFWRGPKSFDEAVSQLLGYLSWRDSKCALLIFNQTKDSSAVKQKMHEIVSARTEHRKTLVCGPQGDSRYVLVKPSDPGREIQIQTMLFDIPKE